MQVTNGSCQAQSSASSIVVNAPPIQPHISANNNQLMSSSSTGNQWYLNDTLIAGAVFKQLTANRPGAYKVRVTKNGCSSISLPFDFNFDISANKTISVYPNPFKDQLSILNNTHLKLNVTVVNVLGVVMSKSSFNSQNYKINTGAWAAGQYFIIVADDHSVYYSKTAVVKQ